MLTDTIERLFADLFPPLTPEDGIADAGLDAAEQRLGVALPTPLRDFHRLCGRRDDLLRKAHDRFYALDQLSVERDALVFCEENQRVVFWAVPLADSAPDDPPVVQGNDQESVWYPECDRLSTFLVRKLCWQAVNALDSAVEAQIGPRKSKTLWPRLEADLGRVDGNAPDTDYELIAYQQGPLVVCAYPSQSTLYAAAKTDAALKAFGRVYRLELDWL